jgi:hypothetical protein
MSGAGWYVDNGVSQHMTCNEISPIFMRKTQACKWSLGDDATYLVTRIGTISFKMPSGDVPKLHDTLFVPNLTIKLPFVLATT